MSKETDWKFIPTEQIPAPSGIKKAIIKLLRQYDSIVVDERDLIDALDVKHDRQELIEAKRALDNLCYNGAYNFSKEFSEDGYTYRSNTCCNLFYITKIWHEVSPNKRIRVLYDIKRYDDYAFAEGLV
jgi:hypothetical protein